MQSNQHLFDPSKTKKEGKSKQKIDEVGKLLSKEDIEIIQKYGKGPYTQRLHKIEEEIQTCNDKIQIINGLRETDTGLSHPSQWNLLQDSKTAKQESTLQVGVCTKILHQGSEEAKYIVAVEHMGRFVVALDEKLAPTDIEQGMRVGIQRASEIGSKLQIQLPLPPLFDPFVSSMEVDEKPDVTYSDIGGCKEQIERIREVIELPLNNPERFEQLGITPPNGILFYGAPGTGKTLCARAVANRTDACFIRVIGSELVKKYVGEGARMVREIFKMAKLKKSCIIFFDEIDAIGGIRYGDSDQEVQRTMLEIVNQLDGFDNRGSVKVLMATNRPDTLDPALIRPGRVDRKIEFGLPDLEGRVQIFKIFAKTMAFEKGIRFELIARLCPNSTGADIRSVCSEAGMFAIRDRRKVIREKDILNSIEKVIKGYEKFSATQKYLIYN